MQIDKICRACLCEDEKLIDIGKTDLYQKFLLFTNLTVEEEIPLNLCRSCEQKLKKNSLGFKEECRKSHEILSNYVKSARKDVKNQLPIEKVSEVINSLKESCYENTNCIQCSYVGSNKKALSRHISRVHKDLKSRWCYTCNGEFDDLTDHVATKHRDEYTCKFCGKKCQTIGYLIDHLRLHSDLKPFRCLFCEKCFIKRNHLKMHLKMHTGENPYKKSFSQLHQLKNHSKLHEEVQTNKPPTCTFCDKKFKKRSELVRHERTHTGTKPFVCQVCGKGFSRKYSCKIHMIVHNIGLKKSCKICNKKFCAQSQLLLHLRTHNGEKPYVCSECGKAFTIKDALAQHSKRHSDLRPYQCGRCNKSFKTPSTLRCHMFRHSGEKPYKCNQCSYSCRQSSGLVKHMQRHVADKPRADKPHVCLICNSSFSTNAVLMCHVNTHNVSFLEV